MAQTEGNMICILTFSCTSYINSYAFHTSLWQETFLSSRCRTRWHVEQGLSLAFALLSFPVHSRSFWIYVYFPVIILGVEKLRQKSKTISWFAPYNAHKQKCDLSFISTCTVTLHEDTEIIAAMFFLLLHEIATGLWSQ